MATVDEKQAAAALYNLEDEMVKLVAYTIVSLRRGHEKIMEGGEGSVIVTDNMTGKAFTAWIIGKYLQETKVPRKKLRLELKYLRVYYVVSYRWPRQPLEFEQKEVALLREIGRAIP